MKPGRGWWKSRPRWLASSGSPKPLAGHVLALEAAGMSLPSMKETSVTLAQVALGWEAARNVESA